MTPRNPVRLTLLVEDSRHERFARMVCKHLGYETRRLTVAPYLVGRGSAKKAVTEAFSTYVQKHRSKSSHQGDLALLVVTDADELEVAARRDQLDEALQSVDVTPVESHERIAVWIPRWHIETWLKYFAGDPNVVETVKYSHNVGSQRERDGADSFFQQYQDWKRDPEELETLPSLANAYPETTRID